MAKVKVRNNETLESALKRFNREVVKAGILRELRDREHYQKPSELRRKLQKERVRKYTLTGTKKHK